VAESTGAAREARRGRGDGRGPRRYDGVTMSAGPPEAEVTSDALGGAARAAGIEIPAPTLRAEAGARPRAALADREGAAE
jgi:hypothetical protein